MRTALALPVPVGIGTLDRVSFAPFVTPDPPETAGRDPYAHFRDVADRACAPVAVLGPRGRVLYVNAAAARTVGVDAPALLFSDVFQVVHPEDRDRARAVVAELVEGAASVRTFDCRVRSGDGSWRLVQTLATNLLDDPTVGGILIVTQDLTDRARHEDELQAVLRTDHLTGLANRAAIIERIADPAIVGPVSMVLVDIDRFRVVNESLGHAIGDEVLRTLAGRLRLAVSSDALVARVSDDVFAIVAEEPVAMAEARAWRLLSRLVDPLVIGGHQIRLSLRAGVAERLGPADDRLLRDAELALHHAKGGGRGRVQVFREQLSHAAADRVRLEADLRAALDAGELDVALQPIVALADRRPVGSEALARWTRSDGEVVPPSQFLPVAEQSGLNLSLGDWITVAAARLAGIAPGGSVSVNLSIEELVSPSVVGRISRALAAHDVPPSSLAFDITENLLIERFDDAIEVIERIRALGCRVGLDDFGSGCSSLSVLRRLPVDYLKIDRSLIAEVDVDARARAIAGAVISLAHTLGIDVIAEGVDREEQVAVLTELGCPHAQGDLFGRPVVV